MIKNKTAALLFLFLGLLLPIATTTWHCQQVEKVWIQPSQQFVPPEIKSAQEWSGIYIAEDFPLFRDGDNYYWLEFTQSLSQVDEPEEKRQTLNDNAPYGRSVLWTKQYAYWLGALEAYFSIFKGSDSPQALYRAAIWANPILFLIFLVTMSCILAMRYGCGIATLFSLLLGSTIALQWDFAPARPDHHGLHQIYFLGQFLFLLMGGMGFVAKSSEQRLFPKMSQAPVYFTIAGVFGAFGLAVGATQQIVVIAILGGLPVACHLAFSLRGTEEQKSDSVFLEPQLWRYWGVVGGVTSLVLYWLEYGWNTGIRLEVNHPIYAILWMLAGESIFRYFKLFEKAEEKRMQHALVLGTALSAVLGIVSMVYLNKHWHGLRDLEMYRLHETISEFTSMTTVSEKGLFQSMLLFFGPLLLGLPTVVYLCFKGPTIYRSLLLSCGLVSSILLLWAVFQYRWVSFAGIALILTVLVIALIAQAEKKYRGVKLLISFIVLTTVSVHLYRLERFERDPGKQLLIQFLLNIGSRDISLNLQQLSKGEDITVMAPFDFVPFMTYFDNLHSVGSLYWENGEGIKSTIDFFVDYTDASAKAIIKERSIDYIVIQPFQYGYSFAEMVHWARYESKDDYLVQKTLAYRLANLKSLPPWLERVPFYGSLPPTNFDARIYRVLPEYL